jgi:MOSC domain-containing protein YiiM
VLGRGDDGAVVRRAGIMAIVLVGGPIEAGDRIAVELPTGDRRRLEVV